MKLYDIAKPFIGIGLREQISNTERSVYQQSRQWMDFKDYDYYVNIYRQMEINMLKSMQEYGKYAYKIHITPCLNKNIKIL